MPKLRIAITCASAEKTPDAIQLANELRLTFYDSKNPSSLMDQYDYLLVLTSDYLGLQSKHSKKPFYIDFLAGKLRHRSNKAGLRRELLAKAISLSPHSHPLIIDATAGLGRDSYILATLGFNVIMLERSAILYALLRDALNRAQQDSQPALVIKRLCLIQADARTWLPCNYLKTTAAKPAVIYLDPMFPERKKSASAKKEMVILRDLLGADDDSGNLFEMALTCANRRVVVKRPRSAANIVIQPKPSYSIIGQSSRFDIYLAPKRE